MRALRSQRQARVLDGRIKGLDTGGTAAAAEDAHLSLAELQHLGQPFPLRGGEVLLRLKLLLQLDGLIVGEPDLTALSFMQGPLDEGSPQQRFPCREEEEEAVTSSPLGLIICSGTCDQRLDQFHLLTAHVYRADHK